MKSSAFTLAEQMVVLVVIGFVATALLSAMRPGDIKKDSLIKTGRSTSLQIEFATKNILAKYSRNYTLERMKESTGEFSIASSGSKDRMVALYRKVLAGKRNSTPSSTYTGSSLTNGSSALSLKVNSFSGFTIKNGTYFGIKLHGNCTTSMNYLYDPSTPNLMEQLLKI